MPGYYYRFDDGSTYSTSWQSISAHDINLDEIRWEFTNDGAITFRSFEGAKFKPSTELDEFWNSIEVHKED